MFSGRVITNRAILYDGRVIPSNTEIPGCPAHLVEAFLRANPPSVRVEAAGEMPAASTVEQTEPDEQKRPTGRRKKGSG
jgi:hypothetical protein